MLHQLHTLKSLMMAVVRNLQRDINLFEFKFLGGRKLQNWNRGLFYEHRWYNPLFHLIINEKIENIIYLESLCKYPKCGDQIIFNILVLVYLDNDIDVGPWEI
jgi:hypothetical protein